MRRNLPFLSLVALTLLFTPFCSKKPAADPCKSEAVLSVTTTPATGSTETPSAGPFSLRVSVISTIPPSGVTIDVKARPESGTTTYFTATQNTSSKDTDFTITNTPSTVTCLVEITVTSKTCVTNKWTGSYRYSKK